MMGNDALSPLASMVKLQPLPMIEVGDAPLQTLELVPGQQIQAHVLATLPNGRFQVVVQDQLLDLNLPHNTEPGSDIELTVLEQRGRLLLGLKADPASITPPQSSVTGQSLASGSGVKLSDAARVLTTLLAAATEEGGHAAASSPVAANWQMPLLDGKPDMAALTTLLRETLSQTGHFYESHQAQWLAGQRPLSQLQQEPQARLAQASPDAALAQGLPQGNAPGQEPPPLSANDLAAWRQVLGQGNNLSDVQVGRLQQLVTQQLGVLDQRQVQLQGPLWAGQDTAWLVRDESTNQGGAEGRHWYSQLDLKLPQLGEVTVKLSWQPQGLTVQFLSNAQTAEKIRVQQSGFHERLQAVGIPILAHRVDVGSGG